MALPHARLGGGRGLLGGEDGPGKVIQSQAAQDCASQEFPAGEPCHFQSPAALDIAVANAGSDDVELLLHEADGIVELGSKIEGQLRDLTAR